LRGCVVLDANLAAPLVARSPRPFQFESAEQAHWLVESGTIAVEKLLVPRRTAA
jgi:hypothetical protein